MVDLKSLGPVAELAKPIVALLVERRWARGQYTRRFTEDSAPEVGDLVSIVSDEMRTSGFPQQRIRDFERTLRSLLSNALRCGTSLKKTLVTMKVKVGREYVRIEAIQPLPCDLDSMLYKLRHGIPDNSALPTKIGLRLVYAISSGTLANTGNRILFCYVDKERPAVSTHTISKETAVIRIRGRLLRGAMDVFGSMLQQRYNSGTRFVILDFTRAGYIASPQISLTIDYCQKFEARNGRILFVRDNHVTDALSILEPSVVPGGAVLGSMHEAIERALDLQNGRAAL